MALLLGMAALALGLVALHSFAQANTAQLAQRARSVVGAGMLAGAAVLLARGALHLAFGLGVLGLWLLSGQALPFSGASGSPPAAGQTSTVRTEHLEMMLDHESGTMRGRIHKGFFAGRAIEDLRPVELAHLWQDCRFSDPQSAQLVEAYLDRVHPTWRDDLARAEADSPKSEDGRMTREEALEILGLGADPGEDDIRRAHRELMMKVHPDRGGSTYLASKVNEAKDVLLAGKG